MPTISVVVPTFNSAGVLEKCLESIMRQRYPREAVEVIVADAGSTDGTLDIANTYSAKILRNPLKTGEAGKAVGMREASKDLIALIDSDNVLPDEGWLERMTEPFSDPEILAAEPIAYSYRREDGSITRYCAMLGMNDPICLFLGNYDRISCLTGRWTDVPLVQKDEGPYLKVQLDPDMMPTIGANGFVFRRALLDSSTDYFFDIDAARTLAGRGGPNFAKVKTGIVHTFSGSISTFSKKQRRRIRDYLHFRGKAMRTYPWLTVNRLGYLKFVMFTVLTIPLLAQAAAGYRRRPDPAWLFHVPACWITLIVYSAGLVGSAVRPGMADRENWRALH